MEYRSKCILDGEILEALDRNKKAKEVGVRMEEVRRELEDLFSESGAGKFSVDTMLKGTRDISPKLSLRKKRNLIALAICNIFAMKRAEEGMGDLKIGYRKRDEAVLRGHRGRAAHQQEKKDEIEEDDTDV